jgi:hypothetical protein
MPSGLTVRSRAISPLGTISRERTIFRAVALDRAAARLARRMRWRSGGDVTLSPHGARHELFRCDSAFFRSTPSPRRRDAHVRARRERADRGRCGDRRDRSRSSSCPRRGRRTASDADSFLDPGILGLASGCGTRVDRRSVGARAPGMGVGTRAVGARRAQVALRAGALAPSLKATNARGAFLSATELRTDGPLAYAGTFRCRTIRERDFPCPQERRRDHWAPPLTDPHGLGTA